MVDKISELNIVGCVGGGGCVSCPKPRKTSKFNFVRIADGFAKNYIPEQMKIPLLHPLGTLFDVKCKVLDFDTLAALSEE